jgi:uncharacterized membrane protein
MEYLAVKWLHIVSSTLLFGTGVGSAYYLLRASLSNDARIAAAVAGHVVLADWLFTTPTALLQPASGLYLVHLAQLPWSTRWIAWSLVLYAVAIGCWLPVLWIQLRMHRVARAAARDGGPLPPAYRRWFRVWFALGVPALVAFLAIFALMVFKPV